MIKNIKIGNAVLLMKPALVAAVPRGGPRGIRQLSLQLSGARPYAVRYLGRNAFPLRALTSEGRPRPLASFFSRHTW